MARAYIPVAIDRRVRAAAQNRCGFCLSPQHLVMGRLQVEHLTPRSKGGTDDESNLWLSCSIYNGHKADKTHAEDPETGVLVPLFNPRLQDWFEHFRRSTDGLRVLGLTPVGRATVVALHLSDDPEALLVRSHWVSVGWHPPKE